MKPLDMSQVLHAWLQAQLEGVHTTIPAIVESYDRATRKAKVLPAIRLLCATGISIPYKPIADVQVIMAGGANWDIDVELEKGDGGLLMFSEASIGNWLNSPGTESVDAEDSSRFSMQDAFFLPGVWPWGKIPEGRPAKGMILRYKDTSITLDDGCKITDKNGNIFEMGSSSVKINGNFEVLQ